MKRLIALIERCLDWFTRFYLQSDSAVIISAVIAVSLLAAFNECSKGNASWLTS